jgi:wyosine [tRNA(Phe)-imidazoG37] synthetase (radical SAM superfamily)
MSSFPILHDIYDSIRFGRVLFAEIAPGSEAGTPCRYCRILDSGFTPPQRAHFSSPESCARAILDTLGKGEAPERIVLGGAGDPLRELAVDSILRRIRTAAHLGTVILSDGALLQDRGARRDADEAEMVVVWLPALHNIEEELSSSEAFRRREAFDRHVAGIAALRRESRAQVVVEIGVRPGENDGAPSVDAWRRALQVIRPHRAHVISPVADASPEIIAALERARDGIGSGVGVALIDPTPVDHRCSCDPARR